MAFKKAQPQQARLKASFFGPPGSGKTFTALLMAEGLAAYRGGRIAFCDTERGTDFYAMKVEKRSPHPEAFDFDAIYTKSLAEILREVKALDPKQHPVVVIDSISHVYQSAIDAYEGKQTSQGGIPVQAWGKIKKPYKELIDYLIGSQLDVFILGRQKNVFDTSTDGEWRKTGVAMKAEGDTQYEPHVCFHMEARVDQRDSTRSTYVMYVEKDRTGVLAGKTIPNPNFDTIRGILPLLGEVQAPIEDEDERIAADSELLDQQETKRAEKETKSVTLFRELQGEIAAATTLEQLGGARTKAAKAKRSLTDEHIGALRLMFESRTTELSNKQVGAL